MLPLFPEFGLESSILAAVLVGVLLLAFFTETFGWVFVGLVVPGYLASVFVIHPESGWTVCLEVVATWALAALLAGPLSRTGAWSHFFGRDRFFLLVLCSILVRLLSELLVLPWLAQRLGAWWGGASGSTPGFFSIGLVLVPLTANASWKLGLRRGLLQVGVPVALTYALLTLVLLPYTNLSFNSLELTYEDVALDFLESPKAYIVLVCSALLATRFNLRFGWDFNGILVPALLSLTWYTPDKLLATIGEVLALVVLTRAALSLPLLRTANLEGPRKLVLVFTLGFLTKYALAMALGGRVPGLKVTDLFGFGYLVPTLLAVKILQKRLTLRILVPTVATSLAGVGLGTAVSLLFGVFEPLPPTPSLPPPQPLPLLMATPLGSMVLARLQADQASGAAPPPLRRRQELSAYTQLWQRLARWVEGPATAPPEEVSLLAAQVGLRLVAQPAAPGTPVSYVLFEVEQRLAWQRGFGVALLTPGAPGPVIEVPYPAREAPSAETGAALCAALHCRILLAGGSDARRRPPPSQAFTSSHEPLRVAHRQLAQGPILQVRADPHTSQGQPLLYHPEGSTALALPLPVSPLVQPPARALASSPKLQILRAHPADLWRYLLAQAPEAPAPTSGVALGEWLMRRAPPALPPGAARPLPPALTEGELSALELRIATPLLTARGEPGGELPPGMRRRWLHQLAGLLGAGVFALPDCAGPGRGCTLLAPLTPGGPLDFATLAVRAEGSERALEVPRPVSDSGALWLGVELWHALEARALLVAGASEPPLSSDAARLSAFHAHHQALHRALAAKQGLVLQVRGFASRAGVDAELILSAGPSVLRGKRELDGLRSLFHAGGPLAFLGERVRLHDESRALAGLGDAGAQLAYSEALGGITFALLWSSEELRGRYAGAERWLAHLTAVEGHPPEERPVSSLFEGLTPTQARASRAQRQAFDALARHATRAQREGDVHALERLRAASPGQVKVRYSPELGLPWLLLEVREGKHVLRGQYFLAARAPWEEPVHVEASPHGPPALAQQAWRQRGVLIVQGALAAPEAPPAEGRR